MPSPNEAADTQSEPWANAALPAPVPMPARQLASFAKVTLAPGESAVVEIVVARRTLSYWDESAHAWTPPPGRVNVFVGGSLADERLTGAFEVA